MAKYREIEKEEQKMRTSYEKVLSKYELSKKVNKATDHQIIQMIFDKTITHSSIGCICSVRFETLKPDLTDKVD